MISASTPARGRPAADGICLTAGWDVCAARPGACHSLPAHPSRWVGAADATAFIVEAIDSCLLLPDRALLSAGGRHKADSFLLTVGRRRLRQQLHYFYTFWRSSPHHKGEG